MQSHLCICYDTAKSKYLVASLKVSIAHTAEIESIVYYYNAMLHSVNA